MAMTKEDEVQRILRGYHKFLVLVCDVETAEWTIVVESTNKGDAFEEYLKLRSKATPTIFIDTSNFVTF